MGITNRFERPPPCQVKTNTSGYSIRTASIHRAASRPFTVFLCQCRNRTRGGSANQLRRWQGRLVRKLTICSIHPRKRAANPNHARARPSGTLGRISHIHAGRATRQGFRRDSSPRERTARFRAVLFPGLPLSRLPVTRATAARPRTRVRQIPLASWPRSTVRERLTPRTGHPSRR
jgi:hypothetical protein